MFNNIGDQKLSGVQLAAQYGISTSTCLSTTRRSNEHWVDQQISRNLTINGPIIQQKAEKLAVLLLMNFHK
ncbi:hypothetical protein RIR_jg27798.t1 [Rhizophagus irregularis DAOM 181602=DAOM 197198]|nr:hypothetical protein RIR_jg27798.t1 [Rhizophagus irregularis DAOM 181602=DAOM 197198]